MGFRLKTLFCIGIIIVCLIAGTVGVSEELIDISRFSDEEIVSLLTQVQTELVNRKIEKTAALRVGKYVGGKDIPAGAYILICETDGDHYGIVWLSAANDDLEEHYPSKLYEFVDSNSKETFYIEIDEGRILNLPFEAKLQISGGVQFK